MEAPELLDTNEAAKYLRIKPATLKLWRQSGRGPVSLKLVRAVKYRRSDLDQFLGASAIRPIGKAATILGGAV